MKVKQSAIARITHLDDKWIVTCERPGSTFRLSHEFNTEEEATKYANTFLREYVASAV